MAKETPEKEDSLEAVVSGPTEIKKKSEGEKLAKTFFKGDVQQIRKGIFKELIIPTIRDTLWGILERAGRGIIYGDSSNYDRDYDRRGRPATREDFTKYSKKRRADEYDEDSERDDIYEFGEILYKLKSDAQDTLDELRNRIDEYHWVSVYQLYEISGRRDDAKWTDRNWGWTNLRDAYITAYRGMYLLKLPRPKHRGE